jgi:hypothetical protein
MAYAQIDEFIQICIECDYNTSEICKTLKSLYPAQDVRPYKIEQRIANCRRKGLLPLPSGNSVAPGQLLRSTSTLYDDVGNVANVWTLATTGEYVSGVISATGDVTGGNLVTVGTASLGNVRIVGDDITGVGSAVTVNVAGADVDFRVSGDNVANLLVTDAGSDTVLINTGTPVTGATLNVGGTESILVPVGNTAQRPVTPVTGMVRFNTTLDVLEFYDADSWTPARADFTVIVTEKLVGDGVSTTFTLPKSSTTAGTIVAINGVVQIPSDAYSVTGRYNFRFAMSLARHSDLSMIA